MAPSADLPSEGGGPLGAVDRFMARIEDAFNLVAALVIFIMMFFMVAEVVGRKVFNAPIPGAIDWIEVSMAAFAFMRSEEHTSELQSLMRISYAVFCLKKKNHASYKQSTNSKKQTRH